MPQLAIAAAGAMIGGAIGGTFIGLSAATIGWSVGAMVGSLLFAPDGPKAELQDTRAAKVQFGAKIPRLDGRARLPGNPRWQSDWRATSQEAGGKGGGGGSEYYTYACDALLWVCEGVDDAVVTRAWHNGKLVYSTLADSDAETIEANLDNELYSALTFYDGNSTQLPWPVYEAAVGTANADGHRGIFCVGIENYQGGQSPQMGLWEFEVATDVTSAASPESPETYTFAGREYDYWVPSSTDFDSYSSVNYQRVDGDWSIEIDALDVTQSAAVASLPVIEWRTFTTGGAQLDVIIYLAGTVGGLRVSIQNGSGFSGPNLTGNGPVDVRVAYTDATNTLELFINGGLYATTTAPELATDWETGAARELVIGQDGSGGVSNGATFSTAEVRLTNNTGTGETVYTPELVDLADIVTAECVRSGLGASLIDVTELVGTDVRGFVRQGSGREAIEQLMAFYYFGCTCRDVLVFRDLGGASAETIPFEDTGVAIDKAGEPFCGVDRGNDQEVPAYWTLSTPDIDADYEAGTETSDRMITESVEKRQVQMTIIATPAERKGRAQSLALRARVESHKFEATLDNSHAELEPFDVVTYTDEDGNTYRTRAERESYDGLVKRFEGVLDSANLPTEGVTSATYTPTINIVPPGTVDGMFIDGPIARDADDDHGFYWVTDFADGASAASLYRSTDDVSFGNVEISTADAITGTASTALGDWTGGNVWDEVNTVRVSVTSPLTASTREAMELDPTINSAKLGVQGREEYLRFRTPTLVSSTATSYTYDLTGLLRGRNGTEHAMASHTAGDRFVLLRLAGLRRVSQDSDQAGLARYYKHVVAGRSVSGATSESFTNAAVGRKPYAPVDGQVARDSSGNATITWARRTRLSHRMTGPLAWSFPLGEATEAYVVTIYTSNTYATVARTISATSETAAYSAAEQTTDFGSPQSTLYFTVAQVSETVGNGYEHRAAA
jgi:hypothetical protein